MHNNPVPDWYVLQPFSLFTRCFSSSPFHPTFFWLAAPLIQKVFMAGGWGFCRFFWSCLNLIALKCSISLYKQTTNFIKINLCNRPLTYTVLVRCLDTLNHSYERVPTPVSIYVQYQPIKSKAFLCLCYLLLLMDWFHQSWWEMRSSFFTQYVFYIWL